MEWEPTLTDPNYDPTDDLWIPIYFCCYLYLLLSLFLKTISPSLSYSSSLMMLWRFSDYLHSSSSFLLGVVFAFLPDFFGTLTDLHFLEHYDARSSFFLNIFLKLLLLDLILHSPSHISDFTLVFLIALENSDAICLKNDILFFFL